MHRILAIGVAGVLALVLCGAATAWSWPADGAVLRPFVLGTDAYAGGQHRGIDVAGPDGSPIRAPAAGVVTFAGSLPTYGRGVTILTPDGYSVTLVHLGAIGVAKGDAVAEGAPVGTMGVSGTPEQAVPSVHLGVRHASEEQGYVDPLGLLPPRAAPAPPAPVADPAPSPVVVPPPAPIAAPPAPPPTVTPPATPAPVAPPVGAPVTTPPVATAPVARAPARPAPVASPAVPQTVDAPAAGEAVPGAAEAPEPFVVSSSAQAVRSRPTGVHHVSGLHVHPPTAAGTAGDVRHAARVAHVPAPGAHRGDVPASQAHAGPASLARATVGGSGEHRAATPRVEQAPVDAATAVETRSGHQLAGGDVAFGDNVPPGARRVAVGAPSDVPRSASADAGVVPGPSQARATDAAAPHHDGGSGLPVRFAWIALAMLVAAVGGRRVARRIVGDGAVLRHHADLLRQLDAAHRPCLHDRGRGRVRTPSATART